MTTTHKYLDQYPISKESEKLIVGTIHPHDTNKFEIPFFYGNVNSIWKILSDAFPNQLQKPIKREGVLKFLSNNKISISDTVVKCERTTTTALDKDFIPIELNKNLVQQIKESNIKEIYFTSGFGKNNAFKLFYEDILGLKITPEIKQKREVILDKKIFDRPIKLTILYSPSGTSNTGLSKSKLYLANKHKYQNSARPVYDFKVDYYRDKFKM